MALSDATQEMMKRMGDRLKNVSAPPAEKPIDKTPLHTKIAQAVLDRKEPITSLDIHFDENTGTLTSVNPDLQEILETAQKGVEALNKKQAMKALLDIKKVLKDTYQLNTEETTPIHLVMARRETSFDNTPSDSHRPAPKGTTPNPQYRS